MTWLGLGPGSVMDSGSSYWKPLKPLGGETPTQYFTSRSGLNLVDSLGGDPLAIQLPYLYKPSANEYLFVADNTALDIANNLGVNPISGGHSGFTLAAWIRHETAGAWTSYFVGKFGVSSVNGRYGISVGVGNQIYVGVQSSGGYKEVTGTTLWTDQVPHLVMLEVDDTAKVIRLFNGATQEGSDVAYTGTFSALTNAYEFYVGAGNSAAGAGVTGICKSSHSDTFVYPFILTEAEKTVLLNRGVVAGAKFHTDCVLREDNKALDLSGNGYHLTGVNCLMSTKKKYSSLGSRQGLDKGYTLYSDFPNKNVYVPYKDNGTELTGYTPTGYTKVDNHPAIANKHNGIGSYIPVTGVDRSSTVTCSYLARATDLQHYYDSVNVSWLHSEELTNAEISNIFTRANRGKIFSKSSGRAIGEIFTYATNKTGANYAKAIKYTEESGILDFDIVVGPHICAVKGTKVLKFDDVHTLSLSTDSGATYPITLLTTLNQVDYAFITDTGNIYFFDYTKAYYSFDNLATYHECTVTGIDANPFVAGNLNNFRPWRADFNEATHNGVKLHTWGTYAASGTAEFNNINQWELIDGETTVKSVYKFGTSLPSLIARHIHTVLYDSISDTFFMTTGDSAVGFDRNNIMQGTRDGSTGVWSWTLLGKGQADTVWANTGIIFSNPYIYLANEGAAGALGGVRRFLRADIANIATNQETIFKPINWSGGLANNATFNVFTSAGVDNYISFSTDMIRFFAREFTEFTVDATYGCYICIGVLSNGYFVFHCLETGEILADYTKGGTLLVNNFDNNLVGMVCNDTNKNITIC